MTIFVYKKRTLPTGTIVLDYITDRYETARSWEQAKEWARKAIANGVAPDAIEAQLLEGYGLTTICTYYDWVNDQGTFKRTGSYSNWTGD